MECPNCHKEIDFTPGETDFCENCRASLEGLEEKIYFQKPSAAENSFQEFETMVAERVNIFPAGYPEENIIHAPGRRTSDCKCLRVCYNQNLSLESNKAATLKLELTPLEEKLKGIMLFLQYEDDTRQKRLQELPIQQILTRGRTVTVAEDFNPGQRAGQVTLDFFIGCRLEDRVNYYKFSVTHRVYDPNEDKDNINQITLNVNANDVADVRIDGMLGRAGKMADERMAALEQKQDHFVEQVLGRIQFDPVIMEIKNETGDDPWDCDKLLLKWNGHKIYLLSNNNPVFGRSSESDLVVRRPMIPSDVKPNGTVSRRHTLLEYLGDRVEFTDKSTYGTWINGKKISGKMSLTAPADDLVEFGDIHWKMQLQECKGSAGLGPKMCKTCLRKKVKSLAFSGYPEDKEYYLLVWQCCELGMVVPQLAGWKLFFRNGTFIAGMPDGRRVFLSPGKRIECNGEIIEVVYFKQ